VASPAKRASNSKSAHSTGLKSALRGDRRRTLGWRWEADVAGDYHCLYGRGGTLVARIGLIEGCWYLLHPKTCRAGWAWTEPGPVCRLCLDTASLEEAKHRAESVALSSLPLVAGVNIEQRELARITNSTSHPMGPPLNRTLGDVYATARITFKHHGPWSDDLEIPAFLQRTIKRTA